MRVSSKLANVFLGAQQTLIMNSYTFVMKFMFKYLKLNSQENSTPIYFWDVRMFANMHSVQEKEKHLFLKYICNIE
jgi:hypothetical protein